MLTREDKYGVCKVCGASGSFTKLDNWLSCWECQSQQISLVRRDFNGITLVWHLETRTISYQKAPDFDCYWLNFYVEPNITEERFKKFLNFL